MQLQQIQSSTHENILLLLIRFESDWCRWRMKFWRKVLPFWVGSIEPNIIVHTALFLAHFYHCSVHLSFRCDLRLVFRVNGRNRKTSTWGGIRNSSLQEHRLHELVKVALKAGWIIRNILQKVRDTVDGFMWPFKALNKWTHTCVDVGPMEVHQWSQTYVTKALKS